MSALATLGNSLSQSTGIPAQAASAPGAPTVSTAAGVQSKIAIPTNPLSQLGNVLGTSSATPIGGRVGGTAADPTPGSAAAVLKNTNATFQQSATDGSNPALGAQIASGQLQAATQLGTTGQNNVNAGTAATASLTTQQQTNTTTLANLQKQSGGAAYQTSATDQNGLQVITRGQSTYDPTSGAPPQFIWNTSSMHLYDNGQFGGQIYALQADGSYKAESFTDEQQLLQITGGSGDVIATTNNYVNQVVSGFTAYGQTSIALQKAAAQTALGKQQLADSQTQTTAAQNQLNGYADQSAENQNTAALGSQLQNIFSSNANALSTTAQQGQQAVTASQQTAGVGPNAGASLEAAGFRGANTSQQQQQAYNVAQATQVDTQGQQVSSALDAQLGLAQKQTGLQLQTMSQDLTEAISALQSDLQYASAEQQVSIQAYINQLQQQQTALQNSVGQSGLDQSHVTQIAAGVASAVSSAGSAYAASATKSGTSK